MKTLFRKAIFAATLAALAPAALSAQNTEAILYGRATIVLTPAVMQQLTSLGATVTDLSHEPMVSGTNVLTAVQGTIDLDNASNEVEYAGGYQIKIAADTIRMQAFTLDLVGPSAVFSAVVIKNGAFVGREPIFSIVAQGAPHLPIVPQNGTISHNGLSLSFEQAFVTLINSAAGNSGLNTTAEIGTLDLYSVLGPLSGRGRTGPRMW